MNPKITCIILEDEDILLQHLRNYVERVEFLDLITTFQNPLEALEFLNKHPVDLVFLDLQTLDEEIDSLRFTNLINQEQHYILTTAHSGYTLQSYEYNMIDYLHKPFPFERFLKAVYKAQKILKPNNLSISSPEEDYMYIKMGKVLQKVNYSEICWFESSRNYIIAFTDTDEITFNMTMEDLVYQLPPSLFVRVHRSFVVSIAKINLINENYVVIMRNNTDKSIAIGETFRDGVMRILEGKVLKKLGKG
jgi:two-component system, LytTR family, response regulator